jgi:phenylalanyl-tRNA synthetase alpha chain
VYARLSHGCQQEVNKQDAEALKKRKLVVLETWKSYQIHKGPKFALEKKKAATTLTHEMLQKCVP